MHPAQSEEDNGTGWNSASKMPAETQRNGGMRGSRSRNGHSGPQQRNSQITALSETATRGKKKLGCVCCQRTGLGDFLNFQPGENYEGLMGTVFAISPAFRNGGIEELREHSVRIHCHGVHFKQTSALEFSETLQFTTRKAGQKIKNRMQIGRVGGANQSTHQGRAGGNNGQSKLQEYAEQTYY